MVCAPLVHRDNKSLTGGYGTDYLGVKNIAESAARHMPKCSHVVLVSSMCIQTPWNPVTLLLNSLLGMVMKWKLEGERALRESGVPYTVVSRLSLLFVAIQVAASSNPANSSWFPPLVYHLCRSVRVV